MTPDNIDTLIHTGSALAWLFAVLGACVYVVRLLAESDNRRHSGHQPRRLEFFRKTQARISE
jgi:hypothetical protein